MSNTYTNQGSNQIYKLPGYFNGRTLSADSQRSDLQIAKSLATSSNHDRWRLEFDYFVTRQITMSTPSILWIQNHTLPVLKEILALNADPSVYSNPKSRILIPFPYIGPKKPWSRFSLDDGKFTFMGRIDLKSIFEDISKLCDNEAREYFIDGSLGWGKSHILALIVCLLMQHRKVIYVPHCKHLMKEDLEYIRFSFFMAYAEDTTKLERLRQITTWEALKVFSNDEFYGDVQLVYVLDQVNAFDQEGDNMDDVDNASKTFVKNILAEMSAKHTLIQGASANIKSIKRQELREGDCGGDGRFFFGGLQSVEVSSWWEYHEQAGLLPSILVPDSTDTSTDDESTTTIATRRKEIDELTGGNFLLLNSLLELKNDPTIRFLDYPSFLSCLVKHKSFIRMKMQISEFFLKMVHTLKDISLNRYLDLMNACVSSGHAQFPLFEMLDARFFRVDEKNTALCNSGYTRSILSSLLRSANGHDQFCTESYYNAIRLFRKNASMTGFLAEMITLSTVGRNGLLIKNDCILPKDTRVVDSFELDSFELNLSSETCFYIPQRYNNAAIDGLILHLAPPLNSSSNENSAVRRALIIPIQISIAARHSPSEQRFFQLWDNIKQQLVNSDYTVEVHFVWITRKALQNKAIREVKGKRMRGGDYKGGCPGYNVTNLNFEDLNKRLGSLLDAAWR